MPLPLEASDFPVLLGAYVGLKILNECLNEMFIAIRHAINPKKNDTLSRSEHDLCQQRKDFEQQNLERKLDEMHKEFIRFRRLFVTYMKKTGQARPEDIELEEMEA